MIPTRNATTTVITTGKVMNAAATTARGTNAVITMEKALTAGIRKGTTVAVVITEKHDHLSADRNVYPASLMLSRIRRQLTARLTGSSNLTACSAAASISGAAAPGWFIEHHKKEGAEMNMWREAKCPAGRGDSIS